MVDLSLVHLQWELARLNLLLRRQAARQAAAEPAAEQAAPYPLYLSPARAEALLQRPFGAPLPLDEAAEEGFGAELAELEERIAGLATQAEAAGEPLRLQRLAQAAGLTRFDLDVFLLALAPSLEERAGRVYGFLQDDLTRKRPSPGLALDVLAGAEADRLAWLARFYPDAPLFRFGLVSLGGAEEENLPFTQRPLLPDETLGLWLATGVYRPPDALQGRLRLRRAAPDSRLLPEAQQTAVQRAAAAGGVIALAGQDELARQTAAETAAQGAPLLTLDLAGDAAVERMAEEIRRLLRDAALIGALPCVQRWDACLQEGAPPPRLLEVVCRFSGPVVLSGRQRWQARGAARERRIWQFTFPLPDAAQRARLLACFLGEAAAGLAAGDLAGQFRLTSGQLRDVVNGARDAAAQAGRPLQTADLFAAARAHSGGRLDALARKITPRYSWDDLILGPDQIDLLREMVNTVRRRPLVLETWGVGQKLAASAGVTALFFGPPGTGKTMGAEVIAGELGLDLYKIDLSTVVSKYIGETEKNLEKIFTAAESGNAILFFDEADAIFGKRSGVKEAHDRYANIEISYLLQRMESFDGVTILATNLKANLDEAFTRRLQFAVDFPFPRAADRLRIWQTLFPPDVPRAPDVDLARMAESFEITGGNIRNIIVNAAYLAAADGQVVRMAHLLRGARRELQKMGRLVDERAFLA